MMVSYVFSIVTALKSKANYCYIGDAHEVHFAHNTTTLVTDAFQDNNMYSHNSV